MVREYLKGFLTGAVAKAVALLMAFFLQLVLAREMGAVWYGEYTYALVWTGFLSILVVGGVDSAAIKFVAELSSHSRRRDIPSFLAWARHRIRQFWLVVIPIGVVLGLVLHVFNLGFSLSVFLILICSVYFQAGNLLASSVLQGLGHPAMAQVPLGILLPLVMMLVLACFHFSGIDAHSEYVALAYVVAMAAISLWVGRDIMRRIPGVRIRDVSSIASNEWRKTSQQLFLMAVVGLILSRFDILLLGWFVSPDKIGIYNVNARLAELSSLALVISNLIVAPSIARHYKRGEIDLLQSMLTMSGRVISILTITAVALLVFFGKSILAWYGDPFVGGYDILLILMVGHLVNALFGPVGNVMIMTGHSAQALRMYAVAAVIMISVALLLIPFFGAYGAAISTATGIVIWNVAMCRYIVRHLHMDPTVLGIFRGHSE